MLLKKLLTRRRINRVTSLLPGANCSACGADDCKGFAGMLVGDRTEAARCVMCDEDMVSRIQEYLRMK